MTGGIASGDLLVVPLLGVVALVGLLQVMVGGRLEVLEDAGGLQLRQHLVERVQEGRPGGQHVVEEVGARTLVHQVPLGRVGDRVPPQQRRHARLPGELRAE